jgi:hypothetical protein
MTDDLRLREKPGGDGPPLLTTGHYGIGYSSTNLFRLPVLSLSRPTSRGAASAREAGACVRCGNVQSIVLSCWLKRDRARNQVRPRP